MPKVKPNADQKYVSYLRVSTEDQGKDGLGINAQRTDILNFINSFGGEVVEEVVEVVSGGSNNRVGFNRAIDICKGSSGNTILLVSKIDRLSRAGFTTMYLLDKHNVRFVEVDSPNDSKFSQGIKFLLAKEEKDKTSLRVRAALDEIRSNIDKFGYHISKKGNKITSLGSDGNLTQIGRDKSIATRRNKAINNPNNIRAIAAARLLPRDLSLRQIAWWLNENGFSTSQGKSFKAIQVANLLKLFGEEYRHLDKY